MDNNTESPKPIKKTLKIKKAITEMLNVQESKHEPLIIKRTELARRLDVTPHLVSYVLDQLNKNREFVIESKRGAKGWIQIKRRVSFREVLDQRPITKERENEIQLCLKNTIDLYFDNVIDQLVPTQVYNKKTVRRLIRNISYVILKENRTSNDVRLMHILQNTINKSLMQDDTPEIDMNGVTIEESEIEKKE